MYAQQLYTGNGTTTSYTVSFSYIQRSHVSVKVDGVLKTDNTHYTWTSDTVIQFTTAPAVNAAIVITRSTSPDSRIVGYTAGATLTKDVLEADSKQAFYIAQESLDRQDNAIGLNTTSTHWDAKSKRIQSLSAPSATTDATTKAYVDTAINDKVTAIGAGNVQGPSTSVAGQIATWGNATGTALLAASTLTSANVLRTASLTSTAGHLPRYSATDGAQIIDSGIPAENIVQATSPTSTSGQVVVADTAKSIKFLANGTEGQSLKITSGTPAWGQMDSSPIVGIKQIPLSNQTSVTITIDSANQSYIAYNLELQSLYTSHTAGTRLLMTTYSANGVLLAFVSRHWFPWNSPITQANIPPPGSMGLYSTAVLTGYGWSNVWPIAGRITFRVPTSGRNGVFYEGRINVNDTVGGTGETDSSYLDAIAKSAPALYQIVFTIDATAATFSGGAFHLYGLRGAPQ